jgi:hypothetical protein
MDAELARKREKAQLLIAQNESATARAAQRLTEQEHATSQRHLYAANLNLLQHAWDQKHTPRVHELLDETRSYQHRGFEWLYWQKQAHQEEATLRGHISYVLAVAVSTDGQWIASGGVD